MRGIKRLYNVIRKKRNCSPTKERVPFFAYNNANESKYGKNNITIYDVSEGIII